jgi:hypothetical protein
LVVFCLAWPPLRSPAFCFLCFGLWDGYEQETKALGFSGIYERYLASQAGFADDAKGYRAVVEAESARTAVVAETAAVEE